MAHLLELFAFLITGLRVLFLGSEPGCEWARKDAYRSLFSSAQVGSITHVEPRRLFKGRASFS